MASDGTELICLTHMVGCLCTITVIHKVLGIQTKKKAMIECMMSPIGIRSSIG